jgi:hypothetical protein
MKQYRIVPQSDGSYYAEYNDSIGLDSFYWYRLSDSRWWGTTPKFLTYEKALKAIEKKKKRRQKITDEIAKHEKFREENPPIYFD